MAGFMPWRWLLCFPCFCCLPWVFLNTVLIKFGNSVIDGQRLLVLRVFPWWGVLMTKLKRVEIDGETITRCKLSASGGF